MLNVNSPLYFVSVGTTSVTVSIGQSDQGKFNTANIINTGVDPVFVFTSATSGTAAYPSSSTTASNVGDVFPAGRWEVRVTPGHNFINLIRKAAATTADVGISLGVDY